jgi:hydrogenase maturation protein HypF
LDKLALPESATKARQMKPDLVGLQIHIKGIVQGVGFRPFVYNLAVQFGLVGWVRNTSGGVDIEVNGSDPAVSQFILTLKGKSPPLARIDRIDSTPCLPNGYTTFTIIESQAKPGEFIPISPDVSICMDCRGELFNPNDRRYRYPFINCTNCGPRFTIIKDIPYDRPMTTMAAFQMCKTCLEEYQDPADRRFHAQPVACPDCGPKVWFEKDNQIIPGDGIEIAREWLREGKILAIKGLGGFHLACDATDVAAVKELRRRKQRSDKPFALMAFDISIIERYCEVSEEEARILNSFAHPIVLLERKPGNKIAAETAPKQKSLGMMLPYTPLHLLILEPAPGFPEVLVMTSGNMSEEPICFEDDDARLRLGGLADGFLMHNRPIHMRVDDSVVREYGSKPYFIRRSRGYAPDPMVLVEPIRPILAVGGELKNVFCLTRQDYAFISHHIGDMENYETYRSFEESISHFERLFRIQPEMIACDLHPNYLASRYARERASRQSIPLIEVQHHHAHLAACLAENGWTSKEPVIGLSFDGTGYGTDGAIWGSEILLGGYAGFQRLYHLPYIEMPGGDLAIRKPARMALASLRQAGLDWEPDLPPAEALCAEEQAAIRSQLEHHLNTVPTSSLGRLFDTVASLIGVCQTATYEGQAAIELEALANPDERELYPVEVNDGLIKIFPMLAAIIADWRAGLPLSSISARFHNSLVQVILEACQAIRGDYSVNTIALSGGVWQNQFLLRRTINSLELQDFKVLIHHQLPPNDGCIALGQALVAEHALK